MTTKTLPHIDIYPMVYSPFDKFARIRKELENSIDLPPVQSGFEIHSPIGHAQHAVRRHDNLLPNLITERLNALESMKAVRSVMPRLQDIPEIRKYRVSYGSHSAAGVDAELMHYGQPLHPGQVLFHGGVFPRNDTTPMNSFVIPNAFSTSLCAQVAATHSTYHAPKDVWILRIAPGSTTRAVVLGFKGQTLGHEMEVLLGAGAQITLQGVHQDGDYTLFEADVF